MVQGKSKNRCFNTFFLNPPVATLGPMDLKEELKIRKELLPGHELALSLLLTREYLARLFDEQVFKRAGITDQQFNVLRILKGGPPDGYLIRDIRSRMIARNADVPRLVDRMVERDLVERRECPEDRRGSKICITPKGDQLQEEVRPFHDQLCAWFEQALSPAEIRTLLDLLQKLRDDCRGQLGVPEEQRLNLP